MANDKDLQVLFHETLKDIYFAEKKILSTLPKMAKAAQSEDLKPHSGRPRPKSTLRGLKRSLRKSTRSRAERLAML